jgi:hypothetical protein
VFLGCPLFLFPGGFQSLTFQHPIYMLCFASSKWSEAIFGLNDAILASGIMELSMFKRFGSEADIEVSVAVLFFMRVRLLVSRLNPQPGTPGCSS